MLLLETIPSLERKRTSLAKRISFPHPCVFGRKRVTIGSPARNLDFEMVGSREISGGSSSGSLRSFGGAQVLQRFDAKLVQANGGVSCVRVVS